MEISSQKSPLLLFTKEGEYHPAQLRDTSSQSTYRYHTGDTECSLSGKNFDKPMAEHVLSLSKISNPVNFVRVVFEPAMSK